MVLTTCVGSGHSPSTCPMTRSDCVPTLEEAQAQLADEARELREWQGAEGSMKIVDYAGCRRNLRVDFRRTFNSRIQKITGDRV